MKKHCFYFLFFSTYLLLFLSGCISLSPKTHPIYRPDGSPKMDVDVTQIPDAIPKEEPLNRYANPSSYRVLGHRYYVLKNAAHYDETGIASWYGMGFHKHHTSTGESYDVYQMTAAHKTLPIPCYVRVINLENGRQVVVRINDRGPFHSNRIIDLSYVAAKKLGITQKGTGLVRVIVVHPNEKNLPTPTLTLKHEPKIYLQVAAFSEYNSAKVLENQLGNYTDMPIRIKDVSHNGNTSYKVQIGPLSNVNSTDHLQALLLRAHLGKPFTIVE